MANTASAGCQLIENQSFSGERSLFARRDLKVVKCTFLEGESPLKECRNIEAVDCLFTWKYPFWYGKNLRVEGCTFDNEAHAGIWYSEDSEFSRCIFKEPKCIRHASSISLVDCRFEQATETLWWCDHIDGRNLFLKGDYVGLQTVSSTFDHIEIQGNYPFDGSRDIKITNSILKSKDAFWNSSSITLENCTIDGEYFGWNSKDITLRHCLIRSHQGFCYMSGITLIDCTIDNSDLTFEYSSGCDVQISSGVLDLKNPISGKFSAPAYKGILLDSPRVKKDELTIVKR